MAYNHLSECSSPFENSENVSNVNLSVWINALNELTAAH